MKRTTNSICMVSALWKCAKCVRVGLSILFHSHSLSVYRCATLQAAKKEKILFLLRIFVYKLVIKLFWYAIVGAVRVKWMRRNGDKFHIFSFYHQHGTKTIQKHSWNDVKWANGFPSFGIFGWIIKTFEQPNTHNFFEDVLRAMW